MEKILSEIKEAFNNISPYIQRHTAEVCPSCPNVCCVKRHSYYDKDDMVFIHALGLKGNGCKADSEDSEPCRFLQEKGCFLPRYMRPFRCTWYFCERLLDSMQSDRAKEYRAFVSAFQNLQNIRQRFLEMVESKG